jgi:hypothetical protein
VVEEGKERRKEERKGDVDYINLSLINIMSILVNEFENTDWNELPNSEVDGYYKKKKLPQNQLDYYNNYTNKIREHHVDFLIKDGHIHLPEYGTQIDRNNKEGIEYALSVLNALHADNIYHGDILGGDLNDEEKLVTINHGNILVKDGIYKLIDFGPTKEEEERPVEELLKAEKTLLERYRKQQTNTLRTEQLNPTLLRARKIIERNKAKRGRYPLTPISQNKSPKNHQGDSPSNSPPPIRSLSMGVGKKLLFNGGKKRRRGTKKKRKRKRKRTKKKKKRRRRSTKKKRRRR